MKSSVLFVLCSWLHCISAQDQTAQSSQTAQTIDPYFQELQNAILTAGYNDPEVQAADANAIYTCNLQQSAVSFSIDNVDMEGSLCNACAQYRACLTLKLPAGKAGIVRSCVKEPTACNPPDFQQYNGRSFRSANVGVAVGATDNVARNGGTQCQIGAAGDTLEFMLKDGPSCQPLDGTPDYAQLDGVTTVDKDGGKRTVGISCRSRVGWNAVLSTAIGSCNASSNPVSECVWRVTLPDCPPKPSPGPSLSPGASLSPVASASPSANRSPSPSRSPRASPKSMLSFNQHALNHVPDAVAISSDDEDDILFRLSASIAHSQLGLPLWATLAAGISLVAALVAAPVLLWRYRQARRPSPERYAPTSDTVPMTVASPAINGSGILARTRSEV